MRDTLHGYLPKTLHIQIPVFIDVSDQAYALKIECDTMQTNREDVASFHPNDIIIVDPNRPLRIGSFVIALLKNTQEVTFKQLVAESGVRYLKPLNPRYQQLLLTENVQICGVIAARYSTFS